MRKSKHDDSLERLAKISVPVKSNNIEYIEFYKQANAVIEKCIEVINHKEEK